FWPGRHESGDHKFSHTVICSVEISPHDVEGQAVITPWCKGQNTGRLTSARAVVGVDRLHHDTSTI
ncbi:hypothetical protein NL367_29030, partial [Klebsiella pneumoniae]|nr:hypothetical protein [Klebsiella pneumoniae]